MPKLRDDNFAVTSDKTGLYNCAAYAVGVREFQVWPERRGGVRWPDELPVGETLDVFIQYFEGHGFSVATSEDVLPATGVERVAIYTLRSGNVGHVARQDPQRGVWHSKLGIHEDIEHLHPADVESDQNGDVALIMERGYRYPEPPPDPLYVAGFR